MIIYLTTYWMLLAAFVLVVSLYALLLSRLATFVQPLRLILAEEGEQLLLDDSLTDSERRQVETNLNTAFSVWPAVVACILTPVVAICSFFGLKTKPSGNASLFRISLLFTISIVAANPLFGALFIAELLVFGAIAAVLTASPAILRALFISLFGFEQRLTPSAFRHA